MKDPTLTTLQQAIYDFICEHLRETGCSPSIREIAITFDIKSQNGVTSHLRALEKKGMIARDRYIPRSLQPTTVEDGVRKPVKSATSGN